MVLPTGEASINVNSGTALYGNTATGAGDDASIVRFPDNEKKTAATISDRMLGGGLADWHLDGATLEADADNSVGVPDPDVARYSTDTAGQTAVSGITETRPPTNSRPPRAKRPSSSPPASPQ